MVSNRVAAEVKNPKITADQKQKAHEAAVKATNEIATMTVSPSLEMKENVDFLLTPAFLIQEALSDDIIATYPSE
jgi:hypothetical protein